MSCQPHRVTSGQIKHSILLPVQNTSQKLDHSSGHSTFKQIKNSQMTGTKSKSQWQRHLNIYMSPNYKLHNWQKHHILHEGTPKYALCGFREKNLFNHKHRSDSLLHDTILHALEPVPILLALSKKRASFIVMTSRVTCFIPWANTGNWVSRN